MIKWCEPKSLEEWGGRLISFRTTFLLLMVFGLIVSELRFGWGERLIGEYLYAVNRFRPEYGRVWDHGKQKIAAMRTLEEMVRVRLSSQQDARSADSMGTLVSRLAESGGMMISASHFLALYGKLQPLYARELISPYTLLNIASGDEWERTYFEKTGQDTAVYLLNHENRVLYNFILSTKLVEKLNSAQLPHIASLDNMEQFAGRIYPASDFFQTILMLPDDVRKAAIAEPLDLIRTKGRILKAGISNEVKNGYIELGFELESGGLRYVIVTPGQEWAVWQLRKLLGRESSGYKHKPNETDDRQIH